MKDNFIISAFSDEAGTSLDQQIAALKRNGAVGCEIRAVDGVNISAIPRELLREIADRFSHEGIRVFSLGSPAGKSPLRADRKKDEEAFARLLEAAHILGAEKIRIFSFFIPCGMTRAQARGEVIDRLGTYVCMADREGIVLCHENERGVYGEWARECRIIADSLPKIKLIFDPANFILSGEDIATAWRLLRDRVDYLHIKDALPDGRIMPAGMGVGKIAGILRDFAALGGRHITVEPHLHVFSGLENLETADSDIDVGALGYRSQDEAFDAAHAALRKVISEA